MSPMGDADPIQQFYTRHPYPPPVANLDRARDEWRDPLRRRAEFHLFWPDRPYRATLDVLVAGCGTWQAPKFALTHPEARVVGIDVSTTSLEHSERLRRRYALTNLELVRLPIEDLSALGQEFDLVVCTGVLHHLADPDAGLHALRTALRPGGVLYLMVYARYGRVGIDMLREYCRKLAIGASARDIADLAATLRPLPDHHPAVATLREARDSGSADALADALLNPRERTYSVTELFDTLDKSGCRFGRWYTQAPYLPTCGAISQTPHASRLASLAARDQYVALELWRGNLARHSLIAYRDDDGSRPADATPSSVPLRRPYTVCVQERVPTGAAAVLLNRNHPHSDLILPVNQQEKRMFDAIDGSRALAAIAREVDVPLEHVAAFATTLARYDQIVFDNSTPRPSHC
jgi:SAM-dependent methyltransferase